MAHAPTSRRRLAPVVFVLLAGAVALLSFADRAPRLVRPALRSVVGLIESFGLPVIEARDLPYDWDVVGHFGLWLSLAVVSWWTFRPRVTAPTLAFTLFMASYAVEIGQSFLTTTRTPDPRDLAANGLGIVVGLMAAAAVEWLASVRWRGSRRSSAFRQRRSVVETTGPSPKVVDAHDAAARPSTRTRNGSACAARTAAHRGSGSCRGVAVLRSGDDLGTGRRGRRVR